MRQVILGLAITIVGVIAFAHGSQKRDGYAVVLGENSHMSNLDLETFLKIRKATTGDFIWVRRNGKSYVIKDAETVRAARAAIAQFEPFRAEEETLEAKMKPLESREDAIDDEIDELGERLEDAERLSEREVRELEREVKVLESKLQEIERELRQLERIEREVEERQERVEERVEREIERLIDGALRDGRAERFSKGRW